MHLASNILWEIKCSRMKFPATCWRLHAIAGGYKQGVLKKMRLREICFNIVYEFPQMREI
ncbi:hypothetical protein SAMN05660493_01992 [Epilithonimonas bovis DSM 19482]|uniref:Uncharacterized protein n=1 Tax=Epilithonimonas bovis DSM 19482 TaxID=1121284 RepID=A0A1U7PWL0_9FLAO|nr:hypothetical protein SAMN05660493_01992 [Epilithonimonas bovis DSM 19482]